MGLFLFGHPFKAIRRAEIENTAVRCFPAPRSARRHGCAARSTSITAKAEESRRARQKRIAILTKVAILFYFFDNSN